MCQGMIVLVLVKDELVLLSKKNTHKKKEEKEKNVYVIVKA